MDLKVSIEVVDRDEEPHFRKILRSSTSLDPNFFRGVRLEGRVVVLGNLMRIVPAIKAPIVRIGEDGVVIEDRGVVFALDGRLSRTDSGTKISAPGTHELRIGILTVTMKIEEIE